MSRDQAKLRQRLAREAARLLGESPTLSPREARNLAVDRLAPRGVRERDLPTEGDISRQLSGLGNRVEQTQGDRFDYFASLLLPLEDAKQHPTYHPEGDALYHSLQVFDHARDREPYDGEFLLAALLHDVGKAIDPRDHVRAGLAALDGHIAARTHWLIEHHMLCHDLQDGRLGSRVRRQLRGSEWYEDLIALGECDRAGRQPDVEVPELSEVIGYLRLVY